MQGVEGQIFSPMARTYGYALAGALLSTFSITPVLASILLPQHVRETETFVVKVIRKMYEPVLRWALLHRKIVVLSGIAFLVLVGFMVPRLGSEFLPHLEEGNLWIRATMPPTISLEAGIPIVKRIREIIDSHPEVLTVVSQHGRPDDGSDAAGFNNAEFFAPLKPYDEWPRGFTKDDLIDQIQKQISTEFTGITMNFSQYIQDNVEEQLSGIKGANSIKIIGRDLHTLEDIANQVLHEMDGIRGVTDLGVFRVLGHPNLNITVDRAKLARYGLNTGDVNNVIQAALGGTQATTVLEGERQFSLIVRLAPQFRNDLAAVGNIKVGYQTPGGANAYIQIGRAHV
jgi:heavy metal efflux system protein